MNSYNILLVDDEPSILNALYRTLQKEKYQIMMANSGEEALNILGETTIHLIISDQKMPGLTGVDFFKIVKEKHPEIIRILLTGCSDLESAISAINYGNIYKYIAKPWDNQDLKITIQHGLEHFQLIEENRNLFELTQKQNLELIELNKNLEDKVIERTRELALKNDELQNVYDELKKNFIEMIRAFSGVIEMRNPILGFHSRRVAALAKSVALKMKLSKDEVLQLEIAGILHDIGKIGIQDSLLNNSNNSLSEKDVKMLENHPIVGQACVQTISNLEKVGLIIRSHHEKFDGTGFPDKLKGNSIPMGSRIIAVADKFDRLTNSRNLRKCLSEKEAVTALKNSAGSELDPMIVNQFLGFFEILKTDSKEINERVIGIKEMREGMILSRDIFTASKILLIAKDEVIKDSYIRKIENFNEIDPIAGAIYIYASPTENYNQEIKENKDDNPQNTQAIIG
ncbi:MAG: hypothetical protein A2161_02440 [Candidatus Schekmanbacteria bacterium RBG_13_48_7]|uniref:Two-component system response regulator n=1 Tax=Candidatus Schekmanbacteria bacterium RBG_13_48_7 TaxID=1817878 RepID=A0A1F7RY42_9BACT|nr:MAG: hypothetical protein A2161_02440 [Candidatus Schekmanbacteria bacterium RBG_13_48_7]